MDTGLSLAMLNVLGFSAELRATEVKPKPPAIAIGYYDRSRI